MMLVMSDKEMPVPSDMTSRAASSIGKLTASAPSSVPAAKITTAMMNRVLVANLRTMNGEEGQNRKRDDRDDELAGKGLFAAVR